MVLVIVGCYVAVDKVGGKNVYANMDELPNQKVGLVLGTSKWLVSGSQNPYFKYRIDAAVQLYRAGKIEFIIVSGDNGTQAYNEPKEMMNELMKQGIPEDKIFADYAGFRTLDSVIRCKEIFGQEEFTIISQPFHNERAVFLARAKGIRAIGFNAQDLKGKSGFKTQLREVFARVKVFIDLITAKQPKFLGEKIEVK